MKSLKNLFAFLVVAIIASSSTFAQTSASDNVGASMNIYAALSIAITDTVHFGAIPTGTGATITVGADGVDANVGTGSNRGFLTISGTPSAGIDITYSTSATLANSAGTTLPAMSVEVYDGTAVDTDGSLAATLDGAGDFDLYIGGSITLAGTETAGAYNTSNTNGSDISVSVDYQ